MCGWTEPRVETLKTLWLDGLSASQVAQALGGVTRNAVIGKVHRLGLSGRGVATTPRLATPRRAPCPPQNTLPRRRPSPVAPRPTPPASPAAVTATSTHEDAVGSVASLEALGAHMCKWPIGDPRSASFSFCGALAETGPYCACHTAVGVRPGAAAASKRDRGLMGYLRRIHAIAA